MTLPAPVRFRPDIETIEPTEPQTVQSLNASFDHINETTFADYGRAVRAVHAKAHALLRARLTVISDLPPELAQGLFARPAAYDAVLRISTNPGDLLDDAISLPRGLALKVLGVEGERLPGAEGATQDFLMVNAPAFAAPDPAKFASTLKTLAGTTDKAEGAKIALSKVLQTVNAALGAVGLQSGALNGLGGAPQVEPLGETYYSTTPFRYGDYVAKFRLRPVAPELTDLTGKTVALHGERDGLRAHLREQMAKIEAEWSFEVQLLRDPEKQKIEDASVVWKEDEAPFAPVAVLRASAQDSWGPDLVAKVDEGLRFSPWTGLAAHQPLGGVNRARREAYRHSADFRARANGCPLHEPETI